MAWLPVIVEPLRPNDTLFELEKVMADKLFEVVPPETLMLPPPPAAAAMLMVFEFWLRVTLLPPAKYTVPVDIRAAVPVVFPDIEALRRPPLIKGG